MKLLFLISPLVANCFAYVVGLPEHNTGASPNFAVTRANTLWLDIAHRFETPLEENGDWESTYYQWMGMDGGANMALSVRYGIGNLFDIGLARYGLTKLYLLESRWNLLDQKVDKTPIQLGVEFNTGLRTIREVDQKSTTGLALLVGRYFGKETFQLQWGNLLQSGVQIGEEYENQSDNWSYAMQFGATYRLNRLSVQLEYIRPLAGAMRYDEKKIIHDAYTLSVGLRTYQHNFSLTLGNHTKNHWGDLVAGADGAFGSQSNLRFGFHISREIGAPY